MNAVTEIILALFLLSCLRLAGASRLKHCIAAAAWQGAMTALYPAFSSPWSGAEHLIFPFLVLIVKGWLLPFLLVRAMHSARVKRELEPLLGYPQSTFLVLLFGIGAFLFCSKYSLAPAGTPVLALPAAFVAMFTGLFIIITRKKAITQTIGFLFFENGITLFGAGLKLEYGFFVELGILLDVFVLVFVMGIAVFQISREFSHIDANELHLLSDKEEGEPLK